ncbi:hypothetical protein, partial [Leptospira wolffii]|uniref:hypothetical protein n=1 Tax=Leptospira wolffii TaxID=409998 RepID=UPI0014386B87
LFNCTSAYIRDRANDLSDIAGVSIDTSVGASASVGPLTVGAIIAQSIARTRNGTACFAADIDSRTYFGLLDPGSNQRCTDAQATFILGLQNSILLHLATVSDRKLLERRKTYGESLTPPLFYYGRLKIRAGLGLGASIELNWLEAIDFVFGFFGIDFLDDDIWKNGYKRDLEEAKNPTE